jgi:hypothetical protein
MGTKSAQFCIVFITTSEGVRGCGHILPTEQQYQITKLYRLYLCVSKRSIEHVDSLLIKICKNLQKPF